MWRAFSNIVMFFWILLVVTIIYKSTTNVYEGIEVKTAPTGNEHDPLYISTVNSANIQVLRDEVRELSTLRSKVDELSQQVNSNTNQITSIITGGD